MAKWIRTTGDNQPTIRVTSPRQPLIEPGQVAAALGAEPGGVPVEGGSSPLGVVARAVEYGKRSQQEAVQRQKVVLNDAQRQQLDDLASSLASGTSQPTSAEVATAVLSIALRSLVGASEEQRVLIAKEIAAASNGESEAAQPAQSDRPYPEPKQRELAEDEKERIRVRIENGEDDVYRLAEEFGCSSSQIAGIKAAMNR
jgi:hypothetical protein